ncbi:MULTISPECIES: ATP-binding protein [Streptomyces]|uniref:AAA family ATPase n=1 Tax=Streptomyces evansiae TaxID=3075535 RepID=A0ABD5E2R6_9ACTN|nr:MULTISPECIES: AAA family ATPase [unclassified Streptomyces]ASY36164.1 regulator [Streptomyces sp. CLI2509]MDT0414917.1 AAA family ATPase [Streptomyces sp. DSM 41982]MYX20278.1 AAA family ATPase [Streptomyces sp. SID8380]
MPGQNPYAHSTFVGRERERSALLDALRTRRLVSLTGPGGIGKTRLAREVSAEAAGKFAHGTHWTDLGPVRDAGQLLTEVARAVGLADQSSRPRAEALCAYLARQRCLLVLDSGEQVWDAVRDLAGDLLTACPGLTVLISARRPLELVEEYVWTLGPLPEDGPEAFALFAEGVAAVRPGGLAPGERVVAARICARLEGIPLALELAAARAARLPLDELARRLESRLDTLVAERQADPGTEWHGGIGAEWPEVIGTEWQEGPGAARHEGGPDRHRTLRTTIGWSHELCLPADRLLWARLTVFRGPFDLQAAREVCAGGPLSRGDVTAGLDRLLACSVLRRHGRGWSMLDTLAEYGAQWLERLGTDEHEALAARHAAYYARLVRLADEEWLGPRQITWFRWAREAYGEVNAALTYLTEYRPDEALDVAGRLVFFWACCGRLHEMRARLETALKNPSATGPHRTRALWALGVAYALHGEYAAAEEVSARGAETAERERDREGMLGAAYAGGLTALLTGDPARALARAEAGLDAAPGPDAGSPGRLRCLLVRVFAYTALGERERAREEAERLRARCLALGERWALSYFDYQLALVHLGEGRAQPALRYARAALESKRAIEDSFGTALCLDLLAATLSAAGQAERAARMSGIAESFWATSGHPQRGTPELAPLRERYEALARGAFGDERWELARRAGRRTDAREALYSWLDGPD